MFLDLSSEHIPSHAAAAKSLQLYLTLFDPIDSSPPGSSVPGVLQAKTLEWVAISFSDVWKWKFKVKSLSHVQLLAICQFIILYLDWQIFSSPEMVKGKITHFQQASSVTHQQSTSLLISRPFVFVDVWSELFFFSEQGKRKCDPLSEGEGYTSNKEKQTKATSPKSTFRDCCWRVLLLGPQ